MKKDLYKTVMSNKAILATRFFASLILAFSGPLELIVQANFIDVVYRRIQFPDNSDEIFIAATLLFLSYMLPAISIVLDYLSQKCEHSFEVSWSRHVNSLISGISYEKYEYEDTYNKIRQVTDSNLFSMIVSYAFFVLTTGISVITYSVILVRISPTLMISVMILSPTVGYFSAKIADKQYKRILSLNTDRRRGIYKSSILHERGYAKDIRINNCADYLTDDWEKTQNEIDTSVLKVKVKYGFLSALVLKTEYIVAFVNLVIVLFTYINNQISLGTFVSISNQILTIRILGAFRNVITQYVNIRSHLRSYHAVVDITDGISNARTIRLKKDTRVETKNLYFKYPHQEDYVLKNVNLEFEAGRSYAIVGENGAGKSTLMKVLIGLYRPSQGDVFVNGMNLIEIPLENRSKFFGVSFQDHSKFGLSLKENIIMNEGTFTSLDLAAIKCFEIDKMAEGLQHGYDTVLGKEFGNAVDLSGGQWQKVSILRALSGKKSIFFFDEPTAALDPIREVEVFERINDLTKNKVRIFITHRLGITTKIDKIIVLKNGEVAEQGSFKELIEMNGLFKEMFDKQRSLYFKEE